MAINNDAPDTTSGTGLEDILDLDRIMGLKTEEDRLRWIKEICDKRGFEDFSPTVVKSLEAEAIGDDDSGGDEWDSFASSGPSFLDDGETAQQANSLNSKDTSAEVYVSLEEINTFDDLMDALKEGKLDLDDIRVVRMISGSRLLIDSLPPGSRDLSRVRDIIGEEQSKRERGFFRWLGLDPIFISQEEIDKKVKEKVADFGEQEYSLRRLIAELDLNQDLFDRRGPLSNSIRLELKFLRSRLERAASVLQRDADDSLGLSSGTRAGSLSSSSDSGLPLGVPIAVRPQPSIPHLAQPLGGGSASRPHPVLPLRRPDSVRGVQVATSGVVSNTGTGEVTVEEIIATAKRMKSDGRLGEEEYLRIIKSGGAKSVGRLGRVAAKISAFKGSVMAGVVAAGGVYLSGKVGYDVTQIPGSEAERVIGSGLAGSGAYIVGRRMGSAFSDARRRRSDTSSRRAPVQPRPAYVPPQSIIARARRSVDEPTPAVVASSGDLSGHNARLVETEAMLTEAMLKTPDARVDFAPEEVDKIMTNLKWGSHPTPGYVLEVAKTLYPEKF